MIRRKTSTFYDFAQHKNPEWKQQAKDHADVDFFYDKEQKAYCRRINNVPGKISGGMFYPKHPLVDYPQSVRL
ncbi:hypothetical protein LCGC14_1650080 [marine sediment metagenome]|uniref:Uncharacterized protein n=1 Tax=marine sediment metagenome TaxID=412755 RepID=A0A0F9KCV6_9ZZZZ